MTRLILLASVLTMSCTSTESPSADDQERASIIDGTKLNPYEYTWQQCALQDGSWVNTDPIQERLDLIDETTIRVTHTVNRANGPITVETMLFQRTGFKPRQLQMEALLPGGNKKDLFAFDLTEDGYTGWSALTGEVEQKQGIISSKMLHGTVLGLPLATLGPQSEPREFAASMMSFDATYRVTATWVGADSFDHKGQNVPVQLVDVAWHHLESGDIYPPGPDASGGRYWLVSDPPPGVPYVLRYRTDTYAVEFSRLVCPK